MSEQNSCGCSVAPKLIYSCSGAADVGGLCDQAARGLTREGVGKMYCLAGVGGGVEAILVNARAASISLALDGCPMDCAKQTLEKGGIENITHLRLSDVGFAKGSSPVTAENIEQVTALARPLLQC